VGSVKQRRWKLVRARRDAVPTSVRKLHQRVRPLSVLSWKFWLAGAATLALVGVVAWVVFATSALGLRDIEVSGSAIAGPDKVRAVVAVAPGTPLARVDTGDVAARVRTLPSVADVAVSRSWPHTLVVEVIERTPVGVVPIPSGFTVLDAGGVVFNEVLVRPEGVVLFRLAAPGPTDPATRSALRVLSALTPPLRAALVEVVAESPTRIRLHLTEDRVVVWGDAERSDTKATVATALLGAGANTIDVTVPDVATTS
jgi:cell division protein FtsQ